VHRGDKPEDSMEDKRQDNVEDILIEQRKMYWTRTTVRGMFVAVAGSVATGSAVFTGALLVWTPELLSRQMTIIVLPCYY
jgi:hypothetical protein